MMNIIKYFMIVVFLSSCHQDNKNIEPKLFYKGSFDVEDISIVETYMQEVSSQWNLRIFKKNRGEMKKLSQGKEAFFIGLYFESDMVLAITNVGVSNSLTVSVHDYGVMKEEKLIKLGKQVREELQKKLEIELLEAIP